MDSTQGNYKISLDMGQGRFVWNNNDVYEGEWQNDKRHGLGIFKS